MKVNLIKDDYKNNEQLYHDFINDRVNDNEEYFSGETIIIDQAPEFPIYMGKGSEEEKNRDFMEAFKVIAASYIKVDRDIHMNELFWHSLLITQKRDYILRVYPKVIESYKDFKNIVIKNFDWENYIYKCVLAAEYVENIDKVFKIDPRISLEEYGRLKNQFYTLIVKNLDIYNYMIKYKVFRNSKFILNILMIIEELKISEVMKAKIKDRPDLGKDERYGRRVIFELNKRYPVVMSPLMDYQTLKGEVINALDGYYDTSELKA